MMMIMNENQLLINKSL